DAGDDDALDGVPDLEFLAQIVGHRRQFEAQRLLHRGLLFRHRIRLGVVGRDLVGVLQPADLDLVGLFLALADDDHVDLLVDRRVGDDARQVAHFLDVVAVEFDDDVAGLDAAGLGRPLVVDAGNQRAARRLDAQAFGNIVGDLLDAQAEPAAAHFAEFAELIDHRHGGVGRHREADAARTAGPRDDRGVDADDLAVEAEQRAAGIAAIDGGVGLNVIVVRP